MSEGRPPGNDGSIPPPIDSTDSSNSNVIPSRHHGSPIPPARTPGDTTQLSFAIAANKTLKIPGYVPPSLADRYPIIDTFLGRGYEGSVFLAYPDDKREFRLALKVYEESTSFDLDLRRRLQNDLYRRHAPRIFNYGVVYDRRTAKRCIGWEAREYFPLGSLADLMTTEPVSLLRSDVVMRKRLKELARLLVFWEKQIGLRDLDFSPSNILIRQDGERPEYVIGDFGGLKGTSLIDRDVAGLILMKFDYVAPEVLAGINDQASPYWSLGVILHEMLTGRLPVVDRHDLTATYELDVSGVEDSYWRRLIAGLLTKDPSTRWTAPQLQSWLDGRGLDIEVRRRYHRDRAFIFRLQEYFDLKTLMQAISQSWDAAASEILEPASIDELASWLMADDHLRRALDECRDAQLPPDRRLATLLTELALRTELAPYLVPEFRGHRIDGDYLRGLASSALGRGNDLELDIVDRLRESRALIAYSRLPACHHYGRLENLWRLNWAHLIRSVNDIGPIDPEIYQHLQPRTTDAAGILLALTSPSELDKQREQLASAETREAISRPWYSSLASQDVRSELEPAHIWLCLNAAKYASEEHEEIERTAEALARNYPHSRDALQARNTRTAAYLQLRECLARHGLNDVVNLLDVVPIDDRQIDHSLARIICTISPTIPATYRGRDITVAGLRRLITEAADNTDTVTLLCDLAESGVLDLYSSDSRPDGPRLARLSTTWTHGLKLIDKHVKPTVDERRRATIDLLRAQLDDDFRRQLKEDAVAAADDTLAMETPRFARIRTLGLGQIWCQIALVLLLPSARAYAAEARARAEKQERNAEARANAEKLMQRQRADDRRRNALAITAWISLFIAVITIVFIVNFIVGAHMRRAKEARQQRVAAAQAAFRQALLTGRVDCSVEIQEGSAQKTFPCASVPFSHTSTSAYRAVVRLNIAPRVNVYPYYAVMVCTNQTADGFSGASYGTNDLIAEVPGFAGGIDDSPPRPLDCQVYDGYKAPGDASASYLGEPIRDIPIDMALDPQHSYVR